MGSAFISVFDAAGANLLYSSLYRRQSDITTTNQHATYGVGVAVDASGNFYLAGTTESNELPVTPGAFQTTIRQPESEFRHLHSRVRREIQPSQLRRRVGLRHLPRRDRPDRSSYQDGIGGIAADAAGNAYVSGNASYDFPVTAGAYNTTPCPSAVSCLNRAFLAKINPAGSALVWATFVGTDTRPDPQCCQFDQPSTPRCGRQCVCEWGCG